MRHAMTVLAAIGATLLAGAAGATTPAATCRQDCAPRVEEQCRDLPGSAFRRCRRTLVRACRKTSPAAACTTTREMTDALANRFVSFDGLGASAVGGLLKLCGDGRFATVDVESADPGSAGSWRVVIGNGGLALDLRAEQISADARFAIGRDDQDAIVVDGRPADTRDARGECGAPLDRETDIEPVAARLRNKLVTLGGAQETLRISLCGRSGTSGGVTLAVTPGPPTAFLPATSFDGTWSLTSDGNDTVLLLELDAAEPRQFVVDVDAAGALLLDGRPAIITETTGCAAPVIDPNRPSVPKRVTNAVTNRVLVQARSRAGGVTTTTLVLCGTHRYTLDAVDSGNPGLARHETGTWSVANEAVSPTLELRSDAALTTSVPIAVDTDGGIILNGASAASGDASAVGATCS